VDPAHVLLGDALGVSDDQDAKVVSKGEGDDLAGRFVMGLVDTATMLDLGSPSPSSVVPPSARALLSSRRPAARRLGLAGLLVTQVQIVLSTNRTA
jgi:hypothetical protein